MDSEFYYPDELTDPLDIMNATLTEDTQEKKENLKTQTKLPATTTTNTQNDDELIRNFITGQQSKSTANKTKCDVNLFKTFCLSQNDTREIHDIPAHELDVLLCKFFMTAVKKDGDQYEPDTLTSIQRSLQRKLQELGVSFNILKDTEFQRSRDVLAAKRKSLVSQGKGNKPNATRALTGEEEDKLFACGYFGEDDPLALQRTLWWVLSMQFGFRARDESHKLRWGDVRLTEDPETGNEVLAWLAERGTKTRTGKENGHRRAFTPTAQATNTNKCPVRLYKTFRAHRPAAMNEEDSPFYLAINHNRKPENEVWYKKCPLGKNKIGQFLSAAVSAGHLGGIKKVANHSVRKTSIGRLLDANCPETFVAQLSGHKSVDSLSHYKVPSAKHQRAMFNVLSRGDDQSFLSSSTAVSARQTNQLPQPQLKQLNEIPSSSVTAVAALPRSEVLKQSQNNQLTINPHEIFRGASIGNISGCSFNFYSSLPTSTCSAPVSPPLTKRRRRAYFLDSDSE